MVRRGNEQSYDGSLITCIILLCDDSLRERYSPNNILDTEAQFAHAHAEICSQEAERKAAEKDSQLRSQPGMRPKASTKEAPTECAPLHRRLAPSSPTPDPGEPYPGGALVMARCPLRPGSEVKHRACEYTLLWPWRRHPPGPAGCCPKDDSIGVQPGLRSFMVYRV